MDADARARMRKRAAYASRVARKMDYHARAVDVWTLADDVLTLLDALDAAEAQLSAVRQTALDEEVISALEFGMVGTPPNVDGLSQGEALGYAVDALRDIRSALSPSPKSPQSREG